MIKKTLIALGAVATTLGVVGTVNAVSTQAVPDHITFVAASPTATIIQGSSLPVSVSATRNTGKNGFDITIAFSEGCGAGATADPATFLLEYVNGETTKVLNFTVSGLSVGTCTVTFDTNTPGAPYKEFEVVTITVNPLVTTTQATTTTVAGSTTTTVAGATTTTVASGGIVAAGSETGPLALMALGLVMLGGVTIASTRRRITA